MDPSIRCMHPGCNRRARKIVGAAEEPNRLGQTHDCCAFHCRSNKKKEG